MIRRLRAFGAFWVDFVLGDDWQLAIGVVLALALTALVAHQTSVPVWWLLPVAVLLLLPFSLWRAVRPRH